MSKFRKYNIVFHNVDQEKCYPILEKYAKNAKEYVMSVEPYPQGNGFHAHLSVEYSNQRSFKAVLKELEKLKVAFIATRPDDAPPGEWGRVQLDRMRGTFRQNENYLLGETKDKPLGDVKTGKKYPGAIIQRMLAFALHRFYEGWINEIPQIIDHFDEEYGAGFSDACYYKWYDHLEGLPIWEKIQDE